MKRITLTAVVVALVVVASVLREHLSAQVVGEVPASAAIVSPTYVAVPAPQQEVITAAPSPQYVWVAGQWRCTPDNWAWTAGKWVQPPFGNAYFVPGYWKHHGGKYVWQAGHWAVANQGVVVAKPVTVPPIYEEVQPAAPVGTPNLVWQPGYWDWRGTWVWVPGQYITTTSPKAVWVAGAWEAAGDGAWRWSPAHWAVS